MGVQDISCAEEKWDTSDNQNQLIYTRFRKQVWTICFRYVEQPKKFEIKSFNYVYSWFICLI